MTTIDDGKTFAYQKYYEKFLVKGSELRMCEDHYAVWQAVVGEIKTKKGECLGIGLENYGCDIWRVLGETIDDLIIKEIEKYIDEIPPKYPQVKDFKLQEAIEYKDGTLLLILILETEFQRTTESVIIGGPC